VFSGNSPINIQSFLYSTNEVNADIIDYPSSPLGLGYISVYPPTNTKLIVYASELYNLEFVIVFTIVSSTIWSLEPFNNSTGSPDVA